MVSVRQTYIIYRVHCAAFLMRERYVQGVRLFWKEKHASGALQSFTYHFRGETGAPAKVVARRLAKMPKDENALRFKAVIEETPIVTKPVSLSGEVKSTLYESLISRG